MASPKVNADDLPAQIVWALSSEATALDTLTHAAKSDPILALAFRQHLLIQAKMEALYCNHLFGTRVELWLKSPM